MNHSPWLDELDKSRPAKKLAEDLRTDVVIIGGGIAGMTTAYYVLKMTDKKVTLLEGGLLAHGATGHNAGQVVSDFEKPFGEIVAEFGQKMALEGRGDIERAWGSLEELIADAKLQVPFNKFIGYTGYSTLEQVLEVLEIDEMSTDLGLAREQMMISEDSPFLKKIPKNFDKFYTVTPQKDILNYIDTPNTKYWAVGGMLKGCLNSALLVEQLAQYLLKTYADRLMIFEHSIVNKVVVGKNKGAVLLGDLLVLADKVVMCTNGIDKIQIVNLEGEKIAERYHDDIVMVQGYMVGYKEISDKSPGAFAYFEEHGHEGRPDFFYLTRRPFLKFNNPRANLVCIGGPEITISDFAMRSKGEVFSMRAQKLIGGFINDNLNRDMNENIELKYTWNGSMGYTKNGMRIIGADPANANLLYNLGCNGIGILPSIFGAQKIGGIVMGKKFEPSIFDPKFNKEKA